jgi:magnesium-transporting ATPase (P-type)
MIDAFELNNVYQSDCLEAMKKLPDDTKEFPEEIDEKNLVFVGLEGMIDPPREEAIEANKKCEAAGIKTVMITGDHKLTATAVAKEIGIKNAMMRKIESTLSSFTTTSFIIFDVPLIEKRSGQVLSLMPNAVQLMDLETYEVFEAPIIAEGAASS